MKQTEGVEGERRGMVRANCGRNSLKVERDMTDEARIGQTEGDGAVFK